MMVPTTPQLTVRRHYKKLSEQDADAVVHAVAELIVSYVKVTGRQITQPAAAHEIPTTHPLVRRDDPRKETLS